MVFFKSRIRITKRFHDFSGLKNNLGSQEHINKFLFELRAPSKSWQLLAIGFPQKSIIIIEFSRNKTMEEGLYKVDNIEGKGLGWIMACFKRHQEGGNIDM